MIIYYTFSNQKRNTKTDGNLKKILLFYFTTCLFIYFVNFVYQQNYIRQYYISVEHKFLSSQNVRRFLRSHLFSKFGRPAPTNGHFGRYVSFKLILLLADVFVSSHLLLKFNKMISKIQWLGN